MRFTDFLKLLPLLIITFLHTSVLSQNSEKKELNQALITSEQSLSENSSGWDISTATYSGNRLLANDYLHNARSIHFRPDGKRIYVVGRGTENVAEFELGTPWDVSTAKYFQELDISKEMGSTNQGSNAHGLYINNSNGTDLYVFNRTEIWQYELSEPWDIRTAKQLKYNDLSAIVSRGHDIDFNPDGTILYIDDRFKRSVFQFSLSIPWDIDSLKLEYSLDISDHEENVRGIELKPDGTRMYIMDTDRKEVLQFDLSNSWEIESAVFSTTFDVSSQSDNPRGITWKPDGSTFYVTHASNSRIYQYYVSTESGSNIDNNGNEDESEIPVQLKPKSKEKNVPNPVKFEWSDVEADYYILHLSQANSAKTQIDVNVESTSYTIDLEPETIYHWRVRGVRDEIEGKWSSIWEFETTTANEVHEFVEKKPELLAPEDREKVSSDHLTFEWSSIDADEYILHISRENEEGTHIDYFLSDKEGITIRGTSYTLPDEPLPDRGHAWRIKGVKDDVAGQWSSISRFETDSELQVITGIVDERPLETSISQNYPNPFNPSTQIEFTLSELQHITLQVYDLTGRQVAVLVEGVKQAGRHTVTFNAERLASGIYISRLITENEVYPMKMILMK